jgi:O-antigen ligase
MRSRAAIGVAPFLVVLLAWRHFGLKGAMAGGAVLAAGLWATSPNLRELFSISIQQTQAYAANNADNSMGEHIEFLRKSLTFVREAPLIGHGTGSIADLFRRSASGQTGAAGVATVNLALQYNWVWPEQHYCWPCGLRIISCSAPRVGSPGSAQL